jgi:uncharacterized flavoprotein (TIGR03862 family)
MAAEVLSAAGMTVTVHDRMPSVGRKLLMAGRGGLNLTHSEEFSRFLSRYGSAAPRLAPALEAFPPAALRAWAEGLGEPTFVGSSGRVFPRSLRASPLLRAWLRRLAGQGVRIRPRQTWMGWDETGRLLFRQPDGAMEAVKPDAVLLALGGASWPKLGSDGRWADILAGRSVAVTPLRPANCGFVVAWTAFFRSRFEGQPLKTIALSFAGRTVRGEAMVTAYGLEGGAVYALSAALREAIARHGTAVPTLDLCPNLTEAALGERLAKPRGARSQATFLRKVLGLPPIAIGLLHEAVGPCLPAGITELAKLIKAVPLRLVAPQPLERAISTAGGVDLAEIDDHFMLRTLPGVFVSGEMLDWEAPTGGYLLQGCFATGAAAAKGALRWLASCATVTQSP